MNEIRSRVRTPQQEQQTPQTQRPSLLKTGAQAEAAKLAEVERQLANQNRTWQPRRFWVPYQGDEGSRTREFIILDSDIAQCPIFYEHNLPDASQGGKRIDFQMCLKELEHCVLCEKFGDSYYVKMISIIELLNKSYTDRNGKEHTYAKRLLPVKYRQQEFFDNLCRDTFQGNMRGAHILTTREPDQKSASIGVPRIAINNETQQVLRYSEEQLQQAYGHPPVHSQQGKLIKEANDDIYPYDYQKLFVTPTAEELRRKYGGVIPAGSTAEVEKVWQDQPADSNPPGIVRQTTPSTNNGQGNDDYLNDPDSEIPF